MMNRRYSIHSAYFAVRDEEIFCLPFIGCIFTMLIATSVVLGLSNHRAKPKLSTSQPAALHYVVCLGCAMQFLICGNTPQRP